MNEWNIFHIENTFIDELNLRTDEKWAFSPLNTHILAISRHIQMKIAQKLAIKFMSFMYTLQERAEVK